MKVVIIDAIAPEGVAHLVERGFEVEQISSKLTREELFQKIADSEAIITRSSTTVNVEFLAHARRLRFLGRAGVGVDNIDIEACSLSMDLLHLDAADLDPLVDGVEGVTSFYLNAGDGQVVFI